MNERRNMQSGIYECHALIAARFRLDGGAMFGIVPKPMWSRHHPSDADNRIGLVARVLLAKDAHRNVLIDTGLGDLLPEKMCRHIDYDPHQARMDQLLAPFGVDRQTITDVILTHLHYDHAGGATYKMPDGTIRPTFPNAVYHVQRSHWETAANPRLRDAASYRFQDFQALTHCGQLQLADGTGKLLPGIEVLVSDGHTIGMQLPLILTGEGLRFFASDLMPTAAHLPLSWHMAYDLQPLMLVEEKQQMLQRAVDQNWTLLFAHDPEITAASVQQQDGRYQIREKSAL